MVERTRGLARTLSADQIARQLNEEGFRTPTGKLLTASKIRWIRYRYGIPGAQLQPPGEITVKEAAERFGVSRGVVYYWIAHGIVAARRINPSSPYWLTIDDSKEKELGEWIANSPHLPVKTHSTSPTQIVEGAV
jgi:hypothetical protein